MNKLPKITLITPTYNQGDYIEETILSVIDQHYPNLEYIIIDGGSTDKTVDIIKKYISNITYWISEPDQGQSDAINKGFSLATGDIINWLNSDDILAPGALITIANQFTEQNATAVTTTVQNFEEDGTRWNELTTTYSSPINYLTKALNNQPGTYFKKEVWDNFFPLPTHLNFVMDQYLWICFWLTNSVNNLKVIDDITVYFRRHSASKTVNSLLNDTFKGFGKAFFNEYNLLFWSYIIDKDADKATVITSYFSDDFDYNSKKIVYPVGNDGAEFLDKLFTAYLFELLKEDYRQGFLTRLRTNLPFINQGHLNGEELGRLNKISKNLLSDGLLIFYRKLYWKFKNATKRNTGIRI